MNDAHYPHAFADACSGYQALKPPNRVSISQGASDNLVIKQTGGSAGAWDASETPYMVHAMDSLASRRHEAVVFVGPARTGKTAGLLLGWMAHNVVNDPGDMLFIQMSKERRANSARLTWIGPCETVRTSPVCVPGGWSIATPTTPCFGTGCG